MTPTDVRRFLILALDAAAGYYRDRAANTEDAGQADHYLGHAEAWDAVRPLVEDAQPKSDPPALVIACGGDTP